MFSGGVVALLIFGSGFGCTHGHCSKYYVVAHEDTPVPCKVWQNPRGVTPFMGGVKIRCK